MTTITTPGFDLERAFARHRGELQGYCVRILGSTAEAEDAVQDTLVRGWRHIDRFEGRASLRSWLFRIATNVCHDMLRGKMRRADPMDLADGDLVAVDDDPADLAVERDAVRRAFVAALALLPPRQRAVVILCDVLRWDAAEVAALLDATPTAVHSMHQRARATLATSSTGRYDDHRADDATVARYVDAFEQYDIATLVGLLRAAA